MPTGASQARHACIGLEGCGHPHSRGLVVVTVSRRASCLSKQANCLTCRLCTSAPLSPLVQARTAMAVSGYCCAVQQRRPGVSMSVQLWE